MIRAPQDVAGPRAYPHLDACADRVAGMLQTPPAVHVTAGGALTRAGDTRVRGTTRGESGDHLHGRGLADRMASGLGKPAVDEDPGSEHSPRDGADEHGIDRRDVHGRVHTAHNAYPPKKVVSTRGT